MTHVCLEAFSCSVAIRLAVIVIFYILTAVNFLNIEISNFEVSYLGVITLKKIILKHFCL